MVALGAARRTRYTLRRQVRSAGDRWPVYRIDAAGRASEWARVHALYGGLAEQYIETTVKFEDGRSGSVSATLKISDAKTFAPVKAAA